MMKVMIMGVGAQGSTIAMRLDEEPNVARIICADYNLEAAQRLEQNLTKATALKVDGNDKNEILEWQRKRKETVTQCQLKSLKPKHSSKAHIRVVMFRLMFWRQYKITHITHTPILWVCLSVCLFVCAIRLKPSTL